MSICHTGRDHTKTTTNKQKQQSILFPLATHCSDAFFAGKPNNDNNNKRHLIWDGMVLPFPSIVSPQNVTNWVNQLFICISMCLNRWYTITLNVSTPIQSHPIKDFFSVLLQLVMSVFCVCFMFTICGFSSMVVRYTATCNRYQAKWFLARTMYSARYQLYVNEWQLATIIRCHI